MKSEAYLKEIRSSKGLPRAVLAKITVEGKKVVFHLVTDTDYSEEDRRFAGEVSANYVPNGYRAEADIVKSVPGADGVRAAIAAFLKEKYPAASAFISPSEIEIRTDETGGRFYLPVGRAERARFASGEVLDALTAELGRRFCGIWFGDYRSVERNEEIVREAPPPAEILRAPRVFPIGDYAPIDGAAPKTAVYIADLTGAQQGVTVCGTVLRIEERMTKKEKPYFAITLSDGSGQMRISYFTRKATIEKVRALKEGDCVCLTGDRELFNGNYSFTARQIDFGRPPEGAPEARPSLPVPERYRTVFPEPDSDFVQADLFGGKPLPEALLKQNFVVFDLETTGLNHTPAAMDRIIEVGAVKIREGAICEKFSTFVACPVRLSAEIVSLTGIEDDMLAGAPQTEEVLADFYKFCDGCILVGHNVQFDLSFVRYYGEQAGYMFDHRSYDTVLFAQELLSLPNYKLNTVADHFGFTFRHHRAYDDAFVTAKIFLELARRKGALPR